MLPSRQSIFQTHQLIRRTTSWSPGYSPQLVSRSLKPLNLLNKRFLRTKLRHKVHIPKGNVMKKVGLPTAGAEESKRNEILLSLPPSSPPLLLLPWWPSNKVKDKTGFTAAMVIGKDYGIDTSGSSRTDLNNSKNDNWWNSFSLGGISSW